MNKHTPGPWSINNGRCIYGNDGMIRPFVAEIADDHNDAETAANARLISSAPDLLAALQAIVENQGNLFPTDWANARAAIAKAIGSEVQS